MPKINVQLKSMNSDLACQLARMSKESCPLVALCYILYIDGDYGMIANLSPRLFPNLLWSSIRIYDIVSYCKNGEYPLVIKSYWYCKEESHGIDSMTYTHKIRTRDNLVRGMYNSIYGRMIGNKIY